MPIAAAIGAGASIIGGLITNHTNKKLSEDANRRADNMHRLNMEYNDVGAQMQRSMAAGVHPMLAAGAQPTDAPTAPDYDVPTIQNPFQSASSVGVNISQQSIQREQLELNAQQLELEGKKVFNAQIQNVVNLLGEIFAKVGPMTSDEVANYVRAADPSLSSLADEIAGLASDNLTITEIFNKIRTSNVDAATKEYIFSTLEKFRQAEYDLLVNQGTYYKEKATESKHSQDLMDAQKGYYQALEKMTDAKRREIEQAIANMKEQWKTLNFQGELDAIKVKNVLTIAEANINKLVAEAHVSYNEATYWVWNELIDASGGTWGIINKLQSDYQTGNPMLSGDRYFPPTVVTK